MANEQGIRLQEIITGTIHLYHEHSKYAHGVMRRRRSLHRPHTLSSRKSGPLLYPRVEWQRRLTHDNIVSFLPLLLCSLKYVISVVFLALIAISICMLRVLMVKVYGACNNLLQADSALVCHFFCDGLKLWKIYQRGKLPVRPSLVLNDVV